MKKQFKKTIEVYIQNGVFVWKGMNEKGEIIYDHILSDARILQIKPIIKDKRAIEKCKHEKLVHVGTWSGLEIGGDVVQCRACAKEFYFTHEEWEKTPKERKMDYGRTPEWKEKIESEEAKKYAKEFREKMKKMEELYGVPYDKILELEYGEFMEKTKRAFEKRIEEMDEKIKIAKKKEKEQLIEQRKKIEADIEIVKKYIKEYKKNQKNQKNL